MEYEFVNPSRRYVIKRSLLLFFLTVSGASPTVLADQQPLPRNATPADPVVSTRLVDRIALAAPGEPIKIWVYLADKGMPEGMEYQAAQDAAADRLTPQARLRLAARTGQSAGPEDVPVYEPYLAQIEEAGGTILQVSRWINAASVSAPPAAVSRLAELPFVLRIDPVATLRRVPLPQPGRSGPEAAARTLKPDRETRLDYGPSFTQLEQLQVPELHDMGLSGRGVLVALLDTGFELDHVAFDSLRNRVEARRNFIQADEPYYGFATVEHGTEVLSVIGGYAQGKLIGPAYGARFLLASTEAVSFEMEVEEDWWVAGVEWADSLGADVISSSLGYIDWYTYSDMDGNTAVVSRAAEMAAARGIVVVNGMGNMGEYPEYNKMGAPADAEGVISVGAVDAEGRRAHFSSIGPTFDGRIKPDVMAMGQQVYMAFTKTSNEYSTRDGTSFSTPLVAGVVALLLEAHPRWTPERVLRTLRQTATQAATPDTLNGFGIVRAYEALRTESLGSVRDFVPESGSGGVFLAWTATLEIDISTYLIERRIYPDEAFGPLVSVDVSEAVVAADGSKAYAHTDTTAVPGASYEYRLQTVGPDGLPLATPSLTTRTTYDPPASNALAATLYPNAPNPFASETRIRFDLVESARVSVTIYDVLGRRVRTLADETLGPGRYVRIWNGEDGTGRPVPSGLYFCRLTADGYEDVRKMLRLR